MNESFLLEAYAGDPLTTTYAWEESTNGGTSYNPIGINSSTLSLGGKAAAANYLYRVTVTFTAPGPCTRTSPVFTLTVNPLPAAPSVINASIQNCATYKIELNAVTSATGGTFTWSNGAFGNPITVNSGGAYQVYYTDVNGCTSTQQTVVPKDPNLYTWIFPKGCFSLCQDQPANAYYTFPRPLLPMNNWSWIQNGVAAASSSVTPVPSLLSSYFPNITTIGNTSTYKMSITNGIGNTPWCSTESELVSITRVACSACPFTVGLNPSAFTSTTTSNAGCLNIIGLDFTNASGAAALVTVTSQNGLLVPVNNAPLNLANGLNTNIKFYFVPYVNVVLPSNVSIEILYANGTKRCTRSVNIPNTLPCVRNFIQARLLKELGNTIGEDNTSFEGAKSNAKFVLQPNPSDNEVEIAYFVAQDDTEKPSQKMLCILDMTGKIVWQQNLVNGIAELKVNTSAFKVGLYQVLLKDNERILESKKLSIIH